MQVTSNSIFDRPTVKLPLITGVLITTLATSILAGIGLYLDWGIVNVGLLAAGGIGLDVLLLTAYVTITKFSKIEPAKTLEEPSVLIQNLKNPLHHDSAAKKLHEILFQHVKKGDHFAYKTLLRQIGSKSLKSMLLTGCDHFKQEISNPITGKYNLFVILLTTIKNKQQRVMFLQETFEALEDDSIDFYLLNSSIIEAIVDLKHDQLFTLMLQKSTHRDSLVKCVITSKLSHDKKIARIQEIARKKNIAINAWELPPHSPIKTTHSILHLCISLQCSNLVEFFAQNPVLLNKTTQARDGIPSMNPLHMAILEGNLEIIEILLKAGVDANGLLSAHGGASSYTPDLNLNVDFFGRQVTHYSPLMLAAIMGREDIANLLIEYGADTQIEDHPEKPGAWKYSDYLKESGARDTRRVPFHFEIRHPSYKTDPIFTSRTEETLQ